MERILKLEEVLQKYPSTENIIDENNIDLEELEEIYIDYINSRNSYENQAEFIANILRGNRNIHTVKSRIKESDRLVEKIIRKTVDRKNKYGNNFQFTIDNYKEEINDIIGVRVMHIFKDEWEQIHNFINATWNVIEITANVRAGDNTDKFNNLNIEVRSRPSGYRSVHYLVELNYTRTNKIIAEIQVRTIFEEGYGEIDHRLRYSHDNIPDILKSNILLFNRIIGSADEMASLINSLSNELLAKDKKHLDLLDEKDLEIKRLKKMLGKK